MKTRSATTLNRGLAKTSTGNRVQVTLRGEFEIVGDIVSPSVEPDDWEANRSLVAEPSGARELGPVETIS